MRPPASGSPLAHVARAARFASALLACGLVGCSPWDKLGDVKLDEPASSVFHIGPDGRTIFVFSSVFNVCDLASDPEGPSGDWWVMSALIRSDIGLGELPAEVYAQVSSGGTVTEHRTSTAIVEVEELSESEDILGLDDPDSWTEGKVDFDFGDDGHVKARFEAEWCGFNLLQGI